MVKMKSFISQNKETGARCLTVFYDCYLDNFNHAIEKGLLDHGLNPVEIQVIAFPKTAETWQARKKLKRRSDDHTG